MRKVKLENGYTSIAESYDIKPNSPDLIHVREVVPIDWGKIWKKIFDDETGYIPNKEERMQIQQLVEEQIKGEV